MKRVFCDRFNTEMKIAFIHLWIGRLESEPLDMCEQCTEALYRFMGMNTAGGGYEKLDSEVAEK